MVLECRVLLPVSFLLFHCWCWLTKHTVKRVMVWVFLRLIYIVCVYMLHLIFQVLRLGDLITCNRNAWMSCIFKYMFKRENYNFFVKIEENTFFKKTPFFHLPSCYWCTICYRRTCHQIYQPGIWCQLISLIHVWRSSIQPTTKLCSIICWLYFYELSRSSLPFSPHFIRTHPITIPSSGVTSIIQPWSGLYWTWWSREKVTDLLKHQIL